MKFIKIPLVNGLGNTKGVEKAPNMILNDFFKSEEVKISGNLIKDNKDIYKKAFESFGKERVVFLGGDHSISYSLTRAFFDWVQNEGRNPCLIIFDSHPDLMSPMLEPTHEEWLKKLIDEGFCTDDILLVGVRKVDSQEKELFNKIRQVSVEELMFDLENKTDAIMEFSRGRDLYVSIDIDCVDPAYAPGTGYLEAGGISSREFLYIIKRIKKMKNLRAIDLVEINPSLDINKMTVSLGRKIVEIFEGDI